MIGKTISHYKITEKLGGGGMGVVYKAIDTKLDRPVALKFLPPELTRDADAKRRFVHEAKAASALQHHNICTIHEIDETEDGHVFIAMDCYEGETLKKRIARGPMPVDDALDIACQMAEGLTKAHEAGMVHRDIKPANIMITSDGVVKIVDFGLAKLAGQTKITKTGTTVGTVAYMSPEQATGKDIDGRTDIWSLGVVLHEMLTGEVPFKGDHEAAVLYGVTHNDPEPVSESRVDVPPDVTGIIETAMCKQPEGRYQSASDMAVDLSRVKHGTSTTGLEANIAKTVRVRNLVGVGLAIVIAAAVVYLGVKKPWSPPTSLAPVLAVVDFRSLGQSDENVVSAGMSGLLHVALVESSPCRVVSPQYLQEIHRRLFGEASGTIAENRALQVARESGATMLLSGQVAASSARPYVTWQLVDTGSGRSLGAQRVEGADLLQLADRIIAAVLPLIAEESGSETVIQSPAVGELTSESPEAYDHYVAGLLARERTGSESAILEFERAIDIDTTFALAYYELSRLHFTAGYTPHMGRTREYANAAWRHRARLSLKDRMRLEAQRYRMEFRLDEAISIFNEMLERWPDDKVLLKELARLLHYHWRFHEAIAVTTSALVLYPDEAIFVHVYASTISLFDRGREALNVSRIYAEAHPDNAGAWHEVGQRYYELSLPDSAEMFFQRALEIDPGLEAAQRFFSYCDYLRGHVDRAIANHERILERDDLPDTQKRRLLAGVSNVPDLAGLHAERGRYQEAFKCIDQAKRFVSNVEDEIWIERNRARLLLRLERESEVLQWGRGVLERTDRDVQHRNAYLYIATALTRLDSIDAAREALEEVRDIQSRWGIPDQKGKLIEARIALAEKNPQAALVALREHKQLYGEVAWGGLQDIEQRELLAQAYQMAGQLDEAARVHEEMARRYGGHALSHYELGKIYEEMKRTGDAAKEYAVFLDMWSEADEGLPQLEDARSRLTALRQAIQ